MYIIYNVFFPTQNIESDILISIKVLDYKIQSQYQGKEMYLETESSNTFQKFFKKA